MIEYDVTCPTCHEEIVVKDPFTQMGRELTCDSCGQLATLEYDESYDPESGEDSYWFYLEVIR